MFSNYAKSAHIYDVRLKQYMDYPAACGKIHSFAQQHHSDAKTPLDVACGTGKHLQFLQEHYQVDGLDISPNMLKIARKRLPRRYFPRGEYDRF
jgi:ubiquinone/menaquinone biosynthesis C-methylase UbiE